MLRKRIRGLQAEVAVPRERLNNQAARIDVLESEKGYLIVGEGVADKPAESRKDK